jgi:hypothetical protein
MQRVKTIFFIVMMMTFFATPFNVAKAQEYFLGGTSSNLSINNGNLTIKKEAIDIKLHVGFAEVSQDFVLQNNQKKLQSAIFTLPYSQDRINSVDNINILVDSSPISSNLVQQLNGTYTGSFVADFRPNQTREIQVSYWQLNGSSIRGLKTFSYNLKNSLTAPANELDLKIELMEGINLESFDKTLNPDLDLGLNPIGWKQQGSILTWAWQNFRPGFNIQANFYWPKSDLAKIINLEQPSDLNDIKTSVNQNSAWQLTDSSYLTSWQTPNPSATTIPEVDIDLSQKKEVNEFRIIPGQTTSINDFQNEGRPQNLELIFDNDSAEDITLADNLSMQVFKLVNPVKTKNVKILIKSVYPGKIDLQNTSISEIEFGTTMIATSPKVILNTPIQSRPKKMSLWTEIWDRLSNLF